jgi:hypothetical protein
LSEGASSSQQLASPLRESKCGRARSAVTHRAKPWIFNARVIVYAESV